MAAKTVRKPKLPDRRDGYYHLNGQKYPSVTTICGVLAKPALIRWAAKQAALAIFNDPDEIDTVEKAVGAIYKKRDDAGDRGSDVHHLIEAYAKGAIAQVEVGDVDNAEGYIKAFLAFVSVMRPTIVYSEAKVVNKTHGYAGKLDMIAKLADGLTWLLDYKTSSGIWPEYGLQLAAYKHAEFLIQEGQPEVPMPAVDRTGIVLLEPDGGYTFKATDEPFDAFLALKRVWEWNKTKGGG